MRRLLPAAVLALSLAACTTGSSPAATPASAAPPPFTDCAGLPTGGKTDLPDLTLPCFTGGAPVKLAELSGPVVINLWASWCGPCREELPAIQRLADATEGRLTVLGVDTRDRPEAAAEFAADRGVTMPTLVDQEMSLAGEIGGLGLPVTVFLDANGKKYVHLKPILGLDELTDLVETHTGITP